VFEGIVSEGVSFPSERGERRVEVGQCEERACERRQNGVRNELRSARNEVRKAEIGD
jgi:hypothetical protein